MENADLPFYHKICTFEEGSFNVSSLTALLCFGLLFSDTHNLDDISIYHHHHHHHHRQYNSAGYQNMT
jgi:hypothetical protein